MTIRMIGWALALAAIISVGAVVTARAISASTPVATTEAATPFVVDIIGAATYADSAVVQRGLEYADGVSSVTMTRSGRNYMQLVGLMTGEVDLLIADVRGLAQDRFSVETVRDARGQLVITLRKLGTPSP